MKNLFHPEAGVRSWAMFFRAEEEKCVENVGFTVEGKKPVPRPR